MVVEMQLPLKKGDRILQLYITLAEIFEMFF